MTAYVNTGHTTVAETIRTLAGFQKSSKGAPAYSRFVNRPLGRVLAALAYQVGLTPNRVTVISALTSLSGILVLGFAPVVWQTGVVVGLLMMLGYALDSADGQLARLTGGGSAAGEWLDHVVDSIKISLLHLTVMVSMYRYDSYDNSWLLLPAAYLLAANVHFFAFILGDMLKRTRGVKPAAQAQKASVLRSVLVAPTDYGLLCVAFLFWGQATLFLAIYGLMTVAMVGYVALGLPKWFKDMVALDAGTR